MNTLTLKGLPDLSVTILSNEFLDNYMPKASGEFVKVYLYFLRYCSCPQAGVSLASAADTFCMTENDVLRALKYWEREGLVKLSYSAGQLNAIQLIPLSSDPSAISSTNNPGQQHATDTDTSDIAAPMDMATPWNNSSDKSKIIPDSPDAPAPNTPPANMYNGTPAYTAQQMEHFKNANGDQLFFVIEQYLGKPLGSTDINIIIFIGEQLGFSSDLIEYLFEYCVSNNHYSIHYIEKTAIAWARDGIDTVAKARARCTYYNKTSFDILKAFGISNRNPAPSEIDHIRRWTREYGFPMPIILEACQRTIEATHTPSFAYAEKILKGWYDHKVGSMDDIKKLDEDYDKKRRHTTQTAAENKQERPSVPTAPKNNKFHNFQQRSYDYGKLQQALFKKSLTHSDGGKTPCH